MKNIIVIMVVIYSASLCGMQDRIAIYFPCPLKKSIYTGDLYGFKQALKTSDPNELDENGDTPLHHLVAKLCNNLGAQPHLNMFFLLLTHDVNPYIANIEGQTAYDKAASCKELQALIDPSITKKKWLALDLRITNLPYQVIDQLVDERYRLIPKKVKDNKLFFKRALFCYAHCGNADRMKDLLSYSNAYVDIKDQEGNTPLMIAAKWGYVDVVRVCTHHGASWRQSNNEGLTPIDIAYRHDREEVCRLVQNRMY